MVVGVVELAPGSDVDEESLIVFCKESLGSMKAPKQIVIKEALPRSAVGKVLKRVIRDDLSPQGA